MKPSLVPLAVTVSGADSVAFSPQSSSDRTDAIPAPPATLLLLLDGNPGCRFGADFDALNRADLADERLEAPDCTGLSRRLALILRL